MTDQEFQEEIAHLEAKHQMVEKLTEAETAERAYCAKLEALQAENQNIIALVQTINKALREVIELLDQFCTTISGTKEE